MSDELLERFWRLLHQTWEDELPSLLAAAAAPDADDEARDVVRRGSVYLTLARAGMGSYPPELIKIIMSLSNGWEQTGDQLVDAAEQLLKERPQ